MELNIYRVFAHNGVNQIVVTVKAVNLAGARFQVEQDGAIVDRIDWLRKD